jgi:hypothetical protein
VNSGKSNLQTTHGDRYDENRPYSISSYVKEVCFVTIKLLDRKDKTAETIKRYFYDFKFKHPTPNDIKEPLKNVFRSANLDWYLVDWTQR